MIRAIIIDDEKPARLVLSKLIEKFIFEVEVIGEANSITRGEEIIKKLKPDIVFLDIEMPGGTGFNLLANFENINFEVIFTTAYAEYALKAIKYSAFDYLTKPIDVDELKECVNKYKKKHSADHMSKNDHYFLPESLNTYRKQSSKIVLPIPKGFKVIEISEILYCKAEGSYTNFHFLNEHSILVGKNLKPFDEQLTSYGFVRIHESILVNIHHIETYVKGRGGCVILKNGESLDVAARRKDVLLKALTNQ